MGNVKSYKQFEYCGNFEQLLNLDCLQIIAKNLSSLDVLYLTNTCKTLRNNRKYFDLELPEITTLKPNRYIEQYHNLGYKLSLDLHSAALSSLSLLKLTKFHKISLVNSVLGDVSVLNHARVVILSGSTLNTKTVMLNVHTVDLSYTNVIDVSTLGNIKVLNLNGTEVHDVSALGNVQNLSLRYTEVVDVSTLGNVKVLNLGHTFVQDISALTNVQELILDFTLVARVSTCTTKILDLQNSFVWNVYALEFSHQLHTLNLQNTNIRDVTALAHIHTLNISNTAVCDVTALASVPELYMRDTQVRDVSMLGNCKILDISYNYVRDISMLGNVPHLIIENLYIEKLYPSTLKIVLLKVVLKDIIHTITKLKQNIY